MNRPNPKKNRGLRSCLSLGHKTWIMDGNRTVLGLVFQTSSNKNNMNNLQDLEGNMRRFPKTTPSHHPF